ncbi:hypothetical protein DINM_004441 [Dirofilaria immitis]|nr:hypothetical protein [Dirofilaria immitis]
MYSSVSSEIAVQSLNLLPHILHSSGFSPTELSLNLVEVVFGGEGFFVDEFGICKKSHLNGFALLCVRQCVFRLPMLINLLLHASHLTDFRALVYSLSLLCGTHDSNIAAKSNETTACLFASNSHCKQ